MNCLENSIWSHFAKDPRRTSELPKGASPAPFLKPNQIKKEKEKKNKREGRKGPGGGDGGRNQNLDEPHREIGSQGATARGRGASPTRPTKP
jgi:hypothetical protein